MTFAFEVTVNFHDSTSPRARRFTNYTDLALYLERVPNMLGFLANNKATITVEMIAIGGQALFELQA